MKEKPILFSGPMVRAILDGRKTQTRRVIKPAPLPDTDEIRYLDEGWAYEAILESETANYRAFVANPRRGKSFRCPYGAPGDRLWVREAHALVPVTAYRASEAVEQVINPTDEWEACVYREGWERCKPGRWRPSIHMPRWASRIVLEVLDVRMERLREISGQDAIAEGIEPFSGDGITTFRDYLTGETGRAAYQSFQTLWQSINGLESWKENPWVWVVEFKRMEAQR